MRGSPVSGFAEFYALYPRHVGRRAAQKAWDREIKSGTDPHEIMSGLRRQIPMLTRRDPQFIPHPATWLNAARWEDEDIAPPSKPTARSPEDTYGTMAHYSRDSGRAQEKMRAQLFGAQPEQEDERYGQRRIDADFIRH